MHGAPQFKVYVVELAISSLSMLNSMHGEDFSSAPTLINANGLDGLETSL